MTIIRNNVKKILSLVILVTIFWSCFEERTGCRDLTAANFDAAADNECIEDDTSPENCPCTYNQLDFDFSYIFQDSLTIDFDTSFLNNMGDTLMINDAYFLFSNFTLTNDSETNFTVQEFADFNSDDIIDEVNDLISVSLSGFNDEVGTIHLNELIQASQLTMGIPTSINDASLDFEENSDLEEIVDSMYIDDQNRMAFARIEVSKINQDTVDYSFEFYEESEMVQLDLVHDTLIQYQDNFKIELEADIFVLFEDVNIEEADASNKIAANFIRFIRQKE